MTIVKHRRAVDPCLEDFSVRLIKARNAKGWSAYDLAREAKIPQSSIWNLESKVSCANAATLVRLCRALGVSADWILGLEQ